MKITNKLKNFSEKKSVGNKHIVLFGVLCLFIIVIHAQIIPKQLRKEVLQSMNPVKPKAKKTKTSIFKRKSVPAPIQNQLAPTINPLNNKGVTLIYLENCDALLFDKIFSPDVQVLKGNVRFRHDAARLYCDSAYFYEKANSLNAYGHVRIVQGDTIFVFGDLLYYDGNTKLARLRHNVRMENRKTILTTDSLNYDRISNMAYYFTGGKITDDLNELTSVHGQYSTSTNNALFKDKVRLLNKDFTLDADSLRYNTNTNIANFIAPTHILYNKETDIYSNKGWYNTFTQKSMLLNRSKVKNKDGRTLVGDTIFYDKKENYGEGFMHVIMNDSVQKTTLYGDYCYYSDRTKNGLATDSALLVDYSEKDTMLIHADTLFTSKDSDYNVARGYYNVRFYRKDVQGRSDSLFYSARDSVLNLYGTPILWAENNQLSGDFIQAYTKNKKIEKINIQHNAVVIQHEDSVYYNQLSGKEIIAYLDSGELRKVNVNGNAETIYYPRDEKDSTLIGLNKTQSSFVVMYLKNKKVKRVVFTTATNGIIYPMTELNDKKMYLSTYFWIEDQRPKNKADLFVVYPKITRPKATGIESLNPTSESSSPSFEKNQSQPINSSINTSPKQNNQQQNSKRSSKAVN
jgi:lipopolysaccharide export system protein LptA